VRPHRTSGATPVPTLLPGHRGSSSGPMSLPPTKKIRAPLRSSPTPRSSSRPLSKMRGLFYSVVCEGKITLVNDLSQL